jgi:diguanylate cyclase (GGDEF)-like protein
MTTSTPSTDPAGPAVDLLVAPARLAALERSGLMDGPAEVAFDRLTRLASRVLYAPVALVSLVDGRRQFFKSAQGLPEPWASRRQTPLTHSFCQHVVRMAGPLVVHDARVHPLVCDNLAIRDLGVIAYLGAPLTTSEGQTLGSFCVIDGKPRPWTGHDLETVSEMAASTMIEVELRMEVARRREAEARLARELEWVGVLNEKLRARTAELAELNTRLERMARIDGLTGLLNIRAMREELGDRAALCRRRGLPMSVLMLDVDHFKAYNDAHGHPAGDDVLVAVAGLIRGGIRRDDLAGRYGGEEFILGLPATGEAEAIAQAERLRRSIASHAWPLRAVTASIGVAAADRPGDVGTLIQAADEALYQAKRAGRDRVHAGWQGAEGGTIPLGTGRDLEPFSCQHSAT